VWVESRDMLALEKKRWKVEHTAAPSGGGGRHGGGLNVAPWANASEGRREGRRAGLRPRMHAS
jgi:hypothetical protein